MPTIFDNITNNLCDQLNTHVDSAQRLDACVGYFNLRGWNSISDKVDGLVGDTVIENGTPVHRYCRLLIGMIKNPLDTIADSYLPEEETMMDNQKANKLKNQLAQELRNQLTIGVPTAADEKSLKQLRQQLVDGKVVVKLFLRHQLHAKLYLTYHGHSLTPKVGLLGSSNLTFAGLSGQGELNIDVLEQDAANKLSGWFEDRWNDRWCIDITKELIELLDESWATESIITPYQIYMKMIYHISREARSGISGFTIPSIISKDLLPFQQNAVRIAAHHLNAHGGVIVGDVVGLGKTITATAIASIFEEDYGYETLVLCPVNLVSMWEDYIAKYRLHGKVLSQSMVTTQLEDMRRYRIVIVDESHNFRNKDGQRYQAIKEYIEKNESKVILLTATPYNKSYFDISNQLRLFIDENQELPFSPEKYIASIGGPVYFSMKHGDISMHSLAAFEKSNDPDDWRELMRHYLVRRTRSFIKNNYAEYDPQNGRYYLTFADGRKSYFTDRIAKKVEFELNKEDASDQYAKLYSDAVVEMIDELLLPRYGLANHLQKKPSIPATPDEEIIMKNLSRAGSQLLGFCRTNMFKRLESSGYAFILSLSRHLLRNRIYEYAIKNGLPLPIGKQEMNFFDESILEDEGLEGENSIEYSFNVANYETLAKQYYDKFAGQFKHRFSWIRSNFFKSTLLRDLEEDSARLTLVIESIGTWDSSADRKLNALENLITNTHGSEKIIVFSQYADTADYIFNQLQNRGIGRIAKATGDSENVSELVYRFSPVSNGKDECSGTDKELRILISTDVLSEGQNLQDCHIVVNYDLPWALIRLIQRAGRVDRIGQTSEEIWCYSFLPEDGIEQIIRLRNRLKKRIAENAEVVGSDEVFFDGDPINIADLYSEKSGMLDEDGEDDDIDLSSYAYQIWHNATKNNTSLKTKIESMSDVVFSAKENTFAQEKEGAIIYAKTPRNTDLLTWVDANGEVITQSQTMILKAAQCEPNTPAVQKLPNHHELVASGVASIMVEDARLQGSLGRKGSVKYRVFTLLSRYSEQLTADGESVDDDLKKAMDDIYKYPLTEFAITTLGRQLKIGISEKQLEELVKALREENRLCITEQDDSGRRIPKVICSLGIVNGGI